MLPGRKSSREPSLRRNTVKLSLCLMGRKSSREPSTSQKTALKLEIIGSKNK